MSTFRFRSLRALAFAVVLTVMVTAFAALSSPAQARQKPEVKLTTSAHAVRTTGSFTLTARTTHKVRGTDVVLQEKRGHGWKVVTDFPYHAGGRLKFSKQPRGVHKLRAVLEKHGHKLDVSPVVVIRVTAPSKSAGSSSTSAPAGHTCTRTSTGSCIAGGQFCKQSMYGQTGYDASGRPWRCTGDTTHPHWM